MLFYLYSSFINVLIFINVVTVAAIIDIIFLYWIELDLYGLQSFCLPSFLPPIFIPFSFSSGNWTGVNISEMTVMYDWYDSLLSHHHLLLLLPLLPLLLELLVRPSSSSPSSSVIITTIYFVSDLLPPELRHSHTSPLVSLIPSVCLSACPCLAFFSFSPLALCSQSSDPAVLACRGGLGTVNHYLLTVDVIMSGLFASADPCSAMWE